MKRQVLLSAPYMLPVVDEFRPFFDKHDIELIIPDVEERLEEAQLLELIEDIDGVICGDDRFTPAVLAKATRLKVISKWGTGIDSIDQMACRKYGVALCNTPGAFTEAVADSVMAYVLAFSRNIVAMDRAMKKGVWEKPQGWALHESTLGVIGVGQIGQAVLKRASSFGMALLGNDVQDIVPPEGCTMVTKEELYARADYISVNCDLNVSSRHLLRTESFNKMKRCPIIINCARGPIVDESALCLALNTGIVAGAGLDVFEQEPLSQDSLLLRMDNVLLAPHNSNSSPAAYARVHKNTIDNLLKHLGRKCETYCID